MGFVIEWGRPLSEVLVCRIVAAVRHNEVNEVVQMRSTHSRRTWIGAIRLLSGRLRAECMLQRLSRQQKTRLRAVRVL